MTTIQTFHTDNAQNISDLSNKMRNEKSEMADTNYKAPKFVSTLYHLLEDSTTDNLISWEGEDGFVIKELTAFCEKLMPQLVKSSSFCSFVRQLNGYGFSKSDPDRAYFRHPVIRRGHPELLSAVQRRKTVKRRSSASNARSEDHQASDGNSPIDTEEYLHHKAFESERSSTSPNETTTKNSMVDALNTQLQYLSSSGPVAPPIHPNQSNLPEPDQEKELLRATLLNALTALRRIGNAAGMWSDMIPQLDERSAAAHNIHIETVRSALDSFVNSSVTDAPRAHSLKALDSSLIDLAQTVSVRHNQTKNPSPYSTPTTHNNIIQPTLPVESHINAYPSSAHPPCNVVSCTDGLTTSSMQSTLSSDCHNYEHQASACDMTVDCPPIDLASYSTGDMLSSNHMATSVSKEIASMGSTSPHWGTNADPFDSFEDFLDEKSDNVVGL